MRSMAIFLVLVAGCPAENAPVSPPQPPEPPPEPPVQVVDSPPVRPPPPTPEQSRGFAAGVNRFGFDLYARIRSRRGNLVFSPASTSMALAMTWGGARGETAREMASVLHFGDDAEALHDAASRQLSEWNDPDRDVYTLRVVNRLFGARGQPFEEPFLVLTRDRYGAMLEPLDFAGDADASRLHINAWVAAATERRIRDLLPPRSIAPDTRLVLTNVIYFLGKWESPFVREATRPAPFHVEGGQTANVATMHDLTYRRYAEDAAVQVVEMTYRGGAVAMILVVPRANDGLPAVEQTLDAARFDGWIGALSTQRVSLALPKVTIDPPESLPLSAELSAMGMRQAFDRNTADFSGMAVPPTPEDRLFISEVFHKAFVRIDEEGTEAAAATAVIMGPAGAAPPAGEPRVVRADHPFLFFIRDTRSGAILFAARVTDPR